MARFTQGGSSNNGGAELNYVQVVGTQQIISSAPNAIVDLNITTTGKPVQISVTGEGANASAGSWLRLNLFRDNVEIGNAIQMESSAASENVPFAINFIDDVAAGTYNYSARVTTINGGSWTFGEAAGPIINAVELTGFKGDRGLRGITGAPGADGAAGADGADALWNFTGSYEVGASYAVGDVATYNGETWYRINANGGNTGDTPTEGTFWTLIAQKGADGADGTGGTADIADFVFTSDGEESRMTIANHDMRIETTRDDNQDADIELNSADDIWINANDTVEIQSTSDSVRILTSSGNNTWKFNEIGELQLPTDNTTIKSGTSGTFVLETRTITAYSDAQDSTNDINGSAIMLSITEDTQWFADNVNSIATVTFADNTTGQIDSIYDATSQLGFPVIVFGLVDSISKTFADAFPLTIVGEVVQPNVYVEIDANSTGWKFTADGKVITPTGSPTILNPAVPGNITLSAYSGVELSFADVPGAGLVFPDQSIQTTAYTGTDSANHGDFYFDQTTLRVDSSSDMVLEANEGDGSVASQIKIGNGDVPIEISAYDRQENWFNTADWSTAEWQINGGSGGQIVLTGIISIEQHLNNFNADFQKILINDATLAVFNGASYGGGNATIYVSEAPTETTTITSLRFIQSLRSGMLIDLDNQNMEIIGNNMSMDITTTGGNDIVIRSSDDLDLRAEDDIRFYANTDSTQQSWTMDSEGRFQLPGDGYISNPLNSSGDGYGNETLKLVPDSDREDYGQYIIIDPTQPNHIHIRAGGEQDYSTAELILGGERAGVHVSDETGGVTIQAKKEDLSWSYTNINDIESTTFRANTELAEPDYNDFIIHNGAKYVINNVIRDGSQGITEYTAVSRDSVQLVFFPGNSYTFKRDMGQWYWSFNEDGYISGPDEGSLFVSGITKNTGADLYIVSQGGASVVLDGQGEFLGSSENANNQIATIGNVIAAQGTGANGEVTRWSPNFQATGLSFTGANATYPTYNSHYVKNGRMVSFWIRIDLDTVTNFGTGQYITELPFMPLTGTMNHFQAWANVDPAVNPDIAGHVVLQADHLANTNALDLHYLKQAGGANSPLMEAMFTQGAPATLTTSSKIYINGTYITAE